MKIVFCSDIYWPSVGGLETYLRCIAHELSRKHQVKIVAISRDGATAIRSLINNRGKSRESDGNVEIVTLGSRSALPMYLLKILDRVEPYFHNIFERQYYFIRHLTISITAKLIKSDVRDEIEGADIVHSMAPWEISHAVALCNSKQPHLITGFLHTGYWADDKYSLKLFQKFDRIIALTQNEKSEYLHHGISPSRISVIGVPHNMYTAQEKIEKTNLKDGLPKKFVLFLGAKREYKGFDLILNATHILWRKFPDLGFVFAGPETAFSQEIFRAYGNDKRVINIEYVSDEEKRYLLETCLLVCLPSKTEIMPNVILEAWAAKKTVVTSDIPNLIELVEDGGLCVTRDAENISNAISFLIENPAKLSLMGKKGYEKCHLVHSPKNISSQLEMLYLALLGSN